MGSAIFSETNIIPEGDGNDTPAGRMILVPGGGVVTEGDAGGGGGGGGGGHWRVLVYPNIAFCPPLFQSRKALGAVSKSH